MKKPGFPLFRLLLDYLSGKSALRNSSIDPEDESWQLLLSSFSARVSIACRMHTNNTHRIFFLHTFPGFARIELLVNILYPDGTVQEQVGLHASGYAFNTLTDSRNVVIAQPGASASIVSLSVHYISHGVTYHLHMDADKGTQELEKEGRTFQHGPKYALALRSITLTKFSPAPIITNTRHGMIPLSLASC